MTKCNWGALIIAASAILLAGCGDQEDISGREKLTKEVLEGRQQAALPSTGKKPGSGMALEPYDPLPPKNLKNKDVAFGAKVNK
ncbi:MAG: hypothetical protein JSS65_03830 [Armatimonadetes bacterium]|nr:hypothetical protein [Armatimonadota bacterium]